MFIFLFIFHLKNDLREETSEVVRWNINRDSMKDKQRALLDLMPALKRDILHQVLHIMLYCMHIIILCTDKT